MTRTEKGGREGACKACGAKREACLGGVEVEGQRCRNEMGADWGEVGVVQKRVGRKCRVLVYSSSVSPWLLSSLCKSEV